VGSTEASLVKFLSAPPSGMQEEVAAVSLCVCRQRDYPCWRHEPDAFGVWFYATYGRPPIGQTGHGSTDWFILQDWSSDTSGELLDLRNRILRETALPAYMILTNRGWLVKDSSIHREAKSLRFALMKFRKAKRLRRWY
jgi:hypothetical protein